MAHISIEEGLPGILGPMKFRPETTAPLRKLAEVLLRDENTLTSSERETIVDGLATWQPEDPADYRPMGKLMAHSGYTRTEWEG